ncbi:MAG: glycosyltransferase family 2 protein [Candidatus Omnitrophica bacterium]|nr:glycosyltransferase family 2 protein [Candidatus Omnitrophota bacterium]
MAVRIDNKCTIVIAVWNERDVTCQCLESLMCKTDYPHKVLIIDNGSDEDTKRFLENFCRDRPYFTIKRFDENLGYLKAANFAFSTLDTPYLCLLNNDTILTDGWLSECISVLKSRTDIGIVSPTTNEISRKFTEIFDAGRLGEYKGKFIETDSCVGSCFIVKKELVDRIDGFDAVYTKGYFEEVDYCFRARQAGFRSVMALGAYITHLSSVSFNKTPGASKKLWHENRDILESRWGKPKRMLFFIKRKYGSDALSRARDYIIKECRSRTIVDVYFKGNRSWIKEAHFNIREKNCLFYNMLSLFIILKFKKKPYDTIVTDIRMPSALFRLAGYGDDLSCRRYLFKEEMEKITDVYYDILGGRIKP